MPKQRQPTEVMVVDFSGGASTIITLPPDPPEPKRAVSHESAAYVPRKTKYQLRIERAKRKKENRKSWRQHHDIELNETKRLLFSALRLLRKKDVAMPKELSDYIAKHEAVAAARIEQRHALLKKFKVNKD